MPGVLYTAPAHGRICGARKKRPPHTPCRRPAGFGTKHYGWGPCILHGGNLPGVIKRLATMRLMRTITDRGYWSEEDYAKAEGAILGRRNKTTLAATIRRSGVSIDYHEALDALMSDTLNRVVDLTQVVNAIPLDEHELRENRTVLARFDAERKLAAQIAKDAIAADVDKRRLELDEAKADRVILALAKAAVAAELTPEQEDAFRRTMAADLKELGPGEPG